MIQSEPKAKPALPRQVLIIEDNKDGRDMLQLVLELWGHHVEVAANGVEGVKKALESHPEVALVDIGLPYLDGYQVAKRLRADFGCRIFLIACTAYGSPEDRRRSLEAGFDVHLVKPVDLEELDGWLERRKGRSAV